MLDQCDRNGLDPLVPGIPSIHDVERLTRTPFFKRISQYSTDFVRRHRQILARTACRWGTDAMHSWSRRWEYPFVVRYLTAFANTCDHQDLVCVDAGSGVSFLPYYITDLLPKSQVLCIDSNRAYQQTYRRLNDVTGCGRVSFMCTGVENIPLPDASADVISCVSVLEHISEHKPILDEFARILKPRGLLVLTFDVALDRFSRLERRPAEQVVAGVLQRFGRLERATFYQKEFAKLDGARDLLTTDYIRRTAPELLPWKYPILKAVADMLRGCGWTGGFHSLCCFCMADWKR